LRKISIKAVLIGGFVDIAASALLGFPLLIFVIVSRHFVGLPPEQLKQAVRGAMHGSPSLHAAQLLIGALCTILGGYVAGRIARHAETMNGLGASSVCMALGVYSVITGKYTGSLAVELVLLFIATPLCGIIGGYLASRRTVRRTAAAA
jgi:drug/metabolite transporter superfamily protein YnfA